MNDPVKVLIVDDSRIFRSVVENCLKDEDDIRVVGSVFSGKKALEFIRRNRPDLVTLDLEMPEMHGLKTLREIRKINEDDPSLPAIGVIMLSIFTRKGADITIQALEEGAFDFITKPGSDSLEENRAALRRQLISKIRFFASRRIAGKRVPASHRHHHQENVQEPQQKPSTAGPEKAPVVKSSVSPRRSRFNAVLIGISTGGPKALMRMMPVLCDLVEIPIFIVQHMPPTFTASLAASLDSKCRHRVVEARDNDRIQPLTVYIAPGGRHMLLRRHGPGICTILNDQPAENGCKPSANVLFRSSVPVFGKEVISVIMTGMGSDGTRGAAAVKRAGGVVIAQDEKTSVVWGMPGSAVSSGIADQVLPLDEIPRAIHHLINRREFRS